MVQLYIGGNSRDDLVRAITELREAMGKRVDFGIPHQPVPDGHWYCHGYQLTIAEFEECRSTGNWPLMNIQGIVERRNEDAKG